MFESSLLATPGGLPASKQVYSIGEAMTMNITPDIDVEELVEHYPKAVNFLADRGIVCIRCGEPYWGTLRELAASKSMGDRVEEIVNDLKAYLAGIESQDAG
jgi:hypothetical protein